MIETAGEACAWLNERHAQRTQIITHAEFLNTEGWDSKVLAAAEKAGWIDQNESDDE